MTNEKIIWEESPKLKYLLGAKMVKPDSDDLTFAVAFFVYLFVPLKFLAVLFFSGLLLFLDLGVKTNIMIFGPLIFIALYNFIRIHYTTYSFSDNTVFIKTLVYGYEKERAIKFQDIGKLWVEEFHNKSGIIHIMPKTKFTFRVRKFFSMGTRHYPTIEYVNNIKSVADLLNKQIDKWKIEAK